LRRHKWLLGPYSLIAICVWQTCHIWVRFLCFLLLQILWAGVVISWSLTVLLAYTARRPSTVIFVTIAGAALYLLLGKKS